MNSREEATFIIIGVALIAALFGKDVRVSLRTVAQQMFASKLTIPLLIYIGLIGGSVKLASEWGLWTRDLTGSTVLWFLFSGFAWFLSLGDAGRDSDFFKRRFVETLGIAAFFEFFINVQVLALPVEIVGQTLLLIVVMLNTFTTGQEDFRAVARLTSGILIVTTTSLLVYTIARFVSDWDTMDNSGLANEFLMPIWLTLALTPFLYVLAAYMGYEVLFVRLSFLNDRRTPSLRARLGMLLELRGALVDVESFAGTPARLAARTRSVSEARRQVRIFKRERAAEAAALAQVRKRLGENAGQLGTDDAGLVVDRREFAQTKDALRYLATCHVGWYRNDTRPDEYRADLLEMLMPIDAHQLRFDSTEPITMKVRKDKQAWFAYRQTPSGHYFGIGASGPPYSQWFYDGFSAPSDYPSPSSAGWTDFMSPDRPEWRPEPKS